MNACCRSDVGTGFRLASLSKFDQRLLGTLIPVGIHTALALNGDGLVGNRKVNFSTLRVQK